LALITGSWTIIKFNTAYRLEPIFQSSEKQGINASSMLQHWVLIPSWFKDKKIAYRTINARSETVAENHLSEQPTNVGGA